MTIQQAKYEYGTRDYISNAGDTLTLIARKLYGTDSDKNRRILQELNTRFDWTKVKQGEIIQYFDSSVLPQINEIW